MSTKVSGQIKSLKDLEHRSDNFRKQQNSYFVISLCFGPACQASANANLHAEFKKEIRKYRDSFDKEIIIRKNGCHGYCEKGPIVVIYPRENCYLSVKKEDIPEIVESVIKDEVIERLIYKDEKAGLILKEDDIPFYKNQERIILLSNTEIDCNSIDD